jgi:hypothetical protein
VKWVNISVPWYLSLAEGDAGHRRGKATPSTGRVRPPAGSLFAAHPVRRRACAMDNIALRTAPAVCRRKVDLMG